MPQVGNYIFTVPICLRGPKDPSYPPPDTAVTDFFQGVPKNNDLSITAHVAFACFIGALHETMHASLVRIHKENSCNGHDLRTIWHERMEKNRRGSFRRDFFAEVIRKAEQAIKRFVIYFILLMPCRQFKTTAPPLTVCKSPQRLADGQPDEPDWDPATLAQQCYKRYSETATKDLVEFIQTLFPGKKNNLCVTYFDEAHELQQSFWSLLRLLQFSDKMWYVFMGTKSSMTYYVPTPENCEYLLLVNVPVSSITSAFSEIAKGTPEATATLYRPRFRPTCDCQQPNANEPPHRHFPNV